MASTIQDWLTNPPSQAQLITTLGAVCVGYIALMTALRTLRASLTLIRYGTMVLALLGVVGMVDEQTAGARGVRREGAAPMGKRGLDYWTERASAQMGSAASYTGWRDVLPSGVADTVPREAKEALDWVSRLVSDARVESKPAAATRTKSGKGRRTAAAKPAEDSPARDFALLALRKAFSGMRYSSRGALTMTGLAMQALNAVR